MYLLMIYTITRFTIKRYYTKKKKKKRKQEKALLSNSMCPQIYLCYFFIFILLKIVYKV